MKALKITIAAAIFILLLIVEYYVFFTDSYIARFFISFNYLLFAVLVVIVSIVLLLVYGPLRKKLRRRHDYNFHVKTYSPMGTFGRIFYTVLIGIGVFFVVRFFVWWVEPQHVATNWLNHINSDFFVINIILFILLSFVTFFVLLLDMGTWFTTWFMKRPYYSEPAEGLRVAFVTCFVPGKEPLEMLEESLIAMRDCDYAHDTWVLDEGNRDEVKELCVKLGVFHFSRHGIEAFNQQYGNFRAKTKAGNLNSWRVTHEDKYDFIAQVDMDHVPHKDYLTKQLGYFKDARVGYVGIPQYYKNMENWIARGASEQTHFFYGPLQQGFYGSNMPFLIGTSHIYRAKAIQDFGGYCATIAEDFITGMHFASHGWKGVYVPEILAEGLGPENWTDYLNQQMRWSYGLFEILFKHSYKHISKLSLKTGINLGYSMLFYFTGFATFLGLILTLLYLFTGINSANIVFTQWLEFALPAYLWVVVIHLYLHRYYI